MSDNRHSPQANGDATHVGELLQEKTQEELISEMADIWDAMDEENYKPQVIDAYLEAINKTAPLSIDAEASLAAFKEKHARLLDLKGPTAISTDMRPMIRNKKRLRTMRLVAAILAVMLICAMTAQALGVDVIGTIARWTDQIFRFNEPAQSDNSILLDTPNTNNFSDLHDAFRTYGVTGMVKPKWYPLDFKQAGVEVIPSRESIKIHATYENGERRIYFTAWLLYSLEDVGRGMYEKDGNDVVLYEINGIEHYIMSNNDQATIVWVKNNLMCSLTGDIPIEHAEAIIKSIYEG